MVSGDELDIEQAFRDHAAPVLGRVARRVNAPKALIEDACSFAWLQAWRYRDRLPAEPEILRAWLTRVAEREAWRLLRAPQPAASDDLAATDQRTRDEQATTHDRLHALDLLRNATPQQARVLALYSAGFTYDEIAAQLGISRTAVNKALVKAKNRLGRL